MSATIHYCPACGFRGHSEAIATALRSELGIDSDLREGFWGTFRIEYEGRVIYDRWRTRGWLGRIGFGRTPTAEEIVALFRRALTSCDSIEAGTGSPMPCDGMPVCSRKS